MQDEMLPPVMMRELFQATEAAKHTPCTWVEFEHAHHMDAHLIAQAVSPQRDACSHTNKPGHQSICLCWVQCGSPPECSAAKCRRCVMHNQSELRVHTPLCLLILQLRYTCE